MLVALVVLVILAGATSATLLRGTNEAETTAVTSDTATLTSPSTTVVSPSSSATTVPITTDPPVIEGTTTVAFVADSLPCYEYNRTTPPGWEGAPVPQDLFYEGRRITRVRRADRSFYPLICFDSNAPLPLCEVVWDLEDPNGAVPVGYRFLEGVTIEGTFEEPLPRNWAEFAQRVPASCWE